MCPAVYGLRKHVAADPVGFDLDHVVEIACALDCYHDTFRISEAAQLADRSEYPVSPLHCDNHQRGILVAIDQSPLRRRQRIIRMALSPLRLLIPSLVSLATPVVASGNDCNVHPDGVAILLGSAHLNARRDDLEEFNPGIFASWNCRETITRVGCFRNSYGDASCGVSWRFDHLELSIGDYNAAPFAFLAHYPGSGRDEAVSINETDWIAYGGIELTHDTLPVFVQVLPGHREYAAFNLLVTIGLQQQF